FINRKEWLFMFIYMLASEARTPPYGVKLCGREFIRAVIFTCGGSRWRRAGEQGRGHPGTLEGILRPACTNLMPPPEVVASITVSGQCNYLPHGSSDAARACLERNCLLSGCSQALELPAEEGAGCGGSTAGLARSCLGA
uniref:Uncharacterized protein n=1 Tax=Varanus komodoensis TaxID=61221 RepID=A0A8D2L8X0_VARKO